MRPDQRERAGQDRPRHSRGEVTHRLRHEVAAQARHPHRLAEELRRRLGHGTSLAHGPFPEADPRYLVADTVEYPVQVNGKVRGHITVAADADRTALEQQALADEKVMAFLAGAVPKKVIVVPGRLVNIVI